MQQDFESIKQSLCELRDGEFCYIHASFAKIELCIKDLDLDDRDFELSCQDGFGLVIVTCHYKFSKREACLLSAAAVVFFAVLFISALGFTHDADEEKRLLEHYCENVKIWNDSKGDNGHPNYKRITCL